VDLLALGAYADGSVAGVSGTASGGVGRGGGAAAAAGFGGGGHQNSSGAWDGAGGLGGSESGGTAGAATLAAVRGVLVGVWRDSSSVEGLNTVLRMQQLRHRRLMQGLLDLKRLYWKCHEFRTAKRQRQSHSNGPGVPLSALSWLVFQKDTAILKQESKET